MSARLLNYRGVKRKGQISWTVHAAFTFFTVTLYLTVFSFIKTLLGILILCSGVFIVCYLAFNKHPVHMMLIAKAYLRESHMSPTPVDTIKVDGLRNIPSLERVFKRFNKD